MGVPAGIDSASPAPRGCHARMPTHTTATNPAPTSAAFRRTHRSAVEATGAPGPPGSVRWMPSSVMSKVQARPMATGNPTRLMTTRPLKTAGPNPSTGKIIWAPSRPAKATAR